MTRTLQAQIPAEGILKRGNWGDAITYQVVCDCHDSEHDHQVWVEADSHYVTVTTYTTQKSNWWSLSRWKIMWVLLTKGYVEYEASIVMTEQQAANYANVLQTAAQEVVAFRKQK